MEALHKRKDTFGRTRPAVSDDFIKIVKKNKSVLDSEIVYNRDYLFDYLGISTLLKSYLNRLDNVVIERPQQMWLRVALGIHGKDLESAIDTYHKLSQKYFTHATPTLFNAGSFKPQLASCFLLHMHDDSIEGIYKTLTDCAKISQVAGGIGVHVHNIRCAGSPIYGTGGVSNGLVPMLKNFNATANFIDQCFEGKTLILTDKGLKPISEVDPKKDCAVASDSNSHLVLEKKNFNYIGDIVEITWQNNEVKVTPEHIFLVIRGAANLKDSHIKEKLKVGLLKMEWVAADKLTNKDVIITNKNNDLKENGNAN